MVKKGPWWFWSVTRLQEAPGQKGPLVVLMRGARGPPRGTWSKRAVLGLVLGRALGLNFGNFGPSFGQGSGPQFWLFSA